LIGELGSEEILFLATDSGNIAAYHTSAIHDGIEREPYRFSKDGRSDLVNVRPFFTYWVHESAWGLSIHKNARMLAVSSNKISDFYGKGLATLNVFAFALTNPETSLAEDPYKETSSGDQGKSEWRCWSPDRSHPEKVPDRSLNWKIRIRAHHHNIPSLSFMNTDDDPEGKYLISVDIEGYIKCWRIWQRKEVHDWDFAPLAEDFRRRRPQEAPISA
jgi:hypothetical protein